MIGRLLGERYRVKGQIGEGGMASVYVAHDERLNRRVAIKVLRSKWAEAKELRERFLIEAQTLSSFDHSNIIRCFDYSGDKSQDLWIVTEILRGSNLSQFVEKYPKRCLHPVIASLIISEVCSALNYAHSKGIYHRDVKPENIFILKDGRVKLMDFGIAKDSNRMRITMTGMFMGSPSYMPPEQIKGDSKIDRRSDIYSLGVMFYEILSGELPFKGKNHVQVIDKIMKGRVVSVCDVASWVPQSLGKMIKKAMAFDPVDRYQNIQDFTFDLKNFLGGFGFADSQSELEAYFSNRSSFERKLKDTVRLRPPRVRHGRPRSPSRVRKPESKYGLNNGNSSLVQKVRNLEELRSSNIKMNPQRYRVTNVAQYSENKHHSNSNFYVIAIVMTIAILILSSFGFLKLYNKLEQIRNVGKYNVGEVSKDLIEQNERSKLSSDMENYGIFRVMPDGEISIDGRNIGNSGTENISKGVPLGIGRHKVKIYREGYHTLSRTINIRKGRNLFRYRLRKKSKGISVSVRSSKSPIRIQVIETDSDSVIEDIQVSTKGHKIYLRPGNYRIYVIYRSRKYARDIEVQEGVFIPTIIAKFE